MFATISDPTGVAYARRLACDFAIQAGMPESRVGKLAIVVTELATNLLKYAGTGDILCQTFDDADGMGIQILSLDKGPGMADVECCLRDGFSTAGSLGHGLGAITRQSDQLRIYSRPQLGTVVCSRFVLQLPSSAAAVQVGTAMSPYPGEVLCGDGWAWKLTKAGVTLLVVDGTGHGSEASRAVEAARQVFATYGDDGCADLLQRLHRALLPTRGAAIAIARIDAAAASIRYAGIGNISGTLVSDGRSTHMISHNGIAGHLNPRIREFVYPYTGNPLVIMHTDGLTSRWNLAAYPGLMAQHPALLAGVILRDFRRGRDDALAVAMRPVA